MSSLALWKNLLKYEVVKIPAEVESCKKKIMSSGRKNPRTGKPYTESEAYAICQAAYNKKKKKDAAPESEPEKSQFPEVTLDIDLIDPKSKTTTVIKMTGLVTKTWTEKAEKEGEPDQRFLEVTTSGKEWDREKQRMAQTAVNDIIAAHKSGKVPAFSNHGISPNAIIPIRTYSWKDILGVWTDANQKGKDVKSTMRLNGANPDADLLWQYTHVWKMPVGFSIGGIVLQKREIQVEVD